MITLSQVSGSDTSPSSPTQQGTIQASYSLSGTQTGALSPSGFSPTPPSVMPSSGIGSGGQVSLTAPEVPPSSSGTGASGSVSGNGVDPTVNALIDLAAQEFAAGGGSIAGGGGVVALPTPIDTSSSTASSTSSSGKAVVVLLFLAGVGYYFYKKHKKAA